MIFPTQYATNTADAMKLFLVSPATLLAPREIVSPTTGPKNPSMEYPTTGATGLCPQLDFQMMQNPAITGRQHRTSNRTLIFRYRELSHPIRTIPVPDRAQSGNWKRMLCREEYPNLVTIRGPKPDIAPLTVYLCSFNNQPPVEV